MNIEWSGGVIFRDVCEGADKIASTVMYYNCKESGEYYQYLLLNSDLCGLK